MSDLQSIHTLLDQAARRRRWERAWRGFWKGLFIGTIVWLLALVAYKLLPIPVETLLLAATLSALAAVAGFGLGWFRKMSAAETARWLDQKQALKERLSTALEMSASTKGAEWNQLLIADAATHAREVDPKKLLPFSLPMASRWALIVLLVTAGLGFVPEYRSKAYVQKLEDAEQVKDTARKLAELTKRNIAQHPSIQPATEKTMEQVTDVAEKLQTRAMAKPEAIKELANVADKLKEEAQKLGDNPAMKRMEKAARESSAAPMSNPADLQRKMDAIQKALGNTPDAKAMDKFKRDLEKIQQAATDMANNGGNEQAKAQLNQSLANLSKQAETMGLNLPQLDEAMEALMGARIDQVLKDLDLAMSDLDKMKELAQQLNQLKGQMEQMGKNLPEQLEKGQVGAAKDSLEKMIKELQKPGATSEDLQKLVDEVAKSIDPAKDYGKAAEFLKEAVYRMRQGDKAQASQSLASAAKELDKLLQQSQDMDALLAALEQLKNAQIAIGSGT